MHRDITFNYIVIIKSNRWLNHCHKWMLISIPISNVCLLLGLLSVNTAMHSIGDETVTTYVGIRAGGDQKFKYTGSSCSE